MKKNFRINPHTGKLQRFKNTEDIIEQINEDADIKNAVDKAHEHSNKEILDQIETSKLNIKIGFFNCPNTLGEYIITGIGFKPKLLIFKTGVGDNLTQITNGDGWADAHGNQNASAWAGVFNNSFRSRHSETDCILITSVSGTFTLKASLVSMNDDGFTLNFIVSDSNKWVRWFAIS